MTAQERSAKVGGGQTSAPVALVTVAAKGIGLAIVERLVAGGYRIVIGDSDDRGGSAEAERSRGIGGLVTFRRLDVTAEADVEAVVRGVAEEFGSLALTVNNTGVTTHARIEDLTLDEWRRVLSVDLEGVLLGLALDHRLEYARTKAPREAMRSTGTGHRAKAILLAQVSVLASGGPVVPPSVRAPTS